MKALAYVNLTALKLWTNFERLYIIHITQISLKYFMQNRKFKEIFIFVAGATPQIITETIYALSQKTPPVYPDEIYIVTTRIGRHRIEESLIKKGILKALAEEYNIPHIAISGDSFIVVKDTTGEGIEDIRDEIENEAMGDTITALIMERTRDEASRLHCSLAGGRKTMSFYIGSALQLFGRPWDKLYHVLVSSEFESNPSFFYKPRQEKIIESRQPNGTILHLNTKDAVIQLAELPFIRLGNKLFFRGKGFKELVAEGQREIDTATLQPEMRLNLSARTIHIGDILIEIIPVQLMIYMTFLRQKIEHCKYQERQYCFECTDCFQALPDLSSRPALEKMAQDYRKIYREQPFKAEEFLNKWKEGIGVEVLRGNISKINRTLKEQLNNETILPFYQVAVVKKYAGSRYGIRVEKSKILIE